MTAAKSKTQTRARAGGREAPEPAAPGAQSDTRTLILDGAKTLFNHHGFSKVSMNDIARVAGITRPTVYSYFKSKKDVLNAVIEREGRAVVKVGTESIDPEASAPQQIATMYAAVEKYILDSSILKDIAARDLEVLTPDVINIAMAFESKIVDALAEVVRQGMKEGTLVDDDPVLLAYAMVRLHEAFNFTPFINLEGYDRDRINEFIYRLMARMLLPTTSAT